MLTTTQQHQIIYIAAAAVIAVGAGAAWWAVAPISVSDTSGISADADRTGKEKPLLTTTSDEDTGRFDFSMALQRPLYDPPKAPPTKPVVRSPVVQRPATPPKPAIDWTLVGTILYPDRSVAILSDNAGKMDVKSEGEEVELQPGGVLIKKVDSDQVTLQLRGNDATLKLKKDFGSPPVGTKKKKRRRGY